jgi:hypothetical protein
VQKQGIKSYKTKYYGLRNLANLVEIKDGKQ